MNARLSSKGKTFGSVSRLLAAILTLSLCPFITVSLGQAPSRDITIEAMRSEKRVALVIGNGAYRSAPLRNPVNDARGMAQVLREAGFEVLLVENQDLKGLKTAIVEFGDRLAPGGIGLFYYAGHGLQVRGKSYLIPTDAQIKSERFVDVEAVDLTSVVAQMEEAKTRLNLVILDACRDNPFRSVWRSATRGLAEVVAPAGTLIAYATAPGSLASDGEGANSIYTGELLKAMRLPSLKVEEVFKRVRQEVARRTNGQQVPWESSSLIGDFMFVLPQAAMKGGSDEVMKKGGTAPPIAFVPERPATGFLILEGRPAGTRILLDGRDMGTVTDRPLRLEASAGVHTIRFEASGYTPREGRVEVRANIEQPVQFELERLIEALRAGTIQRRGKDNAEMIYIPAGTFTMGDTHGDGDSDEKPTHQVTLTAFWLDRTEVTNAQFARFIQAGNTARGDWRQYAGGKDQHPVVNVTWNDAVAYCRWADKRLPTEAEWEYAARGTDNRKYPWGSTWEDSRARFSGNRGGEATAPVGSYPSGASPFGVLDMAGNVWEWVSSLYKPYPYSASDDREDLNANGLRVFRGGSWGGDPWVLRSAVRSGVVPAGRFFNVGFRCGEGVE
jgi:formylglycine-generating enzyme required for sulfatase activity